MGSHRLVWEGAVVGFHDCVVLVDSLAIHILRLHHFGQRVMSNVLAKVPDSGFYDGAVGLGDCFLEGKGGGDRDHITDRWGLRPKAGRGLGKTVAPEVSQDMVGSPVAMYWEIYICVRRRWS